MTDALTHLNAICRIMPAIRRPEGPSQFLGASCRLMQAFDDASAFLLTAPRPESVRVDELLAANNAYLQRARDAEAHRDELKTALSAHEEITESCGICRHPFVEGVLTLHDISMGEVHAACCGPERDGYVNLDTEEPIGDDEPIPTGTPWLPDAALRRPTKAVSELRALYRAYVNVLETGRDRIVASGGICDPVDRMEEGDPALIRVRQFLEATA